MTKYFVYGMIQIKRVLYFKILQAWCPFIPTQISTKDFLLILVWVVRTSKCNITKGHQVAGMNHLKNPTAFLMQ